MTPTFGTMRRVRALLQEIRDEAEEVIGDLRASEATDLLEKLGPERSSKPKSKRGAFLHRKETKLTKSERWAQTREVVVARVLKERDGKCEWACPRRADDPHHLLSGSGKKKVFEAWNTVAGVCRACHDLYEEADEDTLRRAARWAQDHGYALALEEITRRLAHALAIRDASAYAARSETA